MNPRVKNILAIVGGWIVGSIVNMDLIQIGHTVLPIDGVDPNDMESLAAVMPTLEFQYFVFPFLAHALGTLAGAFVAGWVSVTHKMRFSLGIGGLFLIGGLAINYMLPGPTWFAIADIALAYIPMAWIGGRLASKI